MTRGRDVGRELLLLPAHPVYEQRTCSRFPNMAEGHTNQSSASVTNSDSKTNTFDNKIEKSSFLFYDAKIFTWKGDLKSLKAFVAR